MAVVFGFWLLAFLYCAFPFALTAQSKTGLIVGQVVDGTTGRPVSGVTVVLFGGPDSAGPGRETPAMEPPLPIITDENGGFVFSTPGRGTYGITAARKGYAEGAYGRLRPNGLDTSLRLGDGERKGDIKIKIWKFGAIAGTIADDTGEPLVGVRVRTLRSTYVAGRRRLVSEATSVTDDRGMYRAGGLLPGDYVVVVPSVQTTLPADLAASLETSTTAGGEVRGVLVGAGLPRTLTNSQEVGGVVVQSSSATGFIRSNGHLFVYPTTYNGDMTSARQAPVIAVGSGETRSGVDIHLRSTPAFTVSGRLMGPPAAMAVQPLRLYPASLAEDLASDTGMETAIALTNRSGAFTFVGVPSGQYVLRGNRSESGIFALGRGGEPTEAWWISEPLTVGNQDVAITATWRAAFSLSGRIVFDGASPPPMSRLTTVPIIIESAAQGQIPGSTPARATPDLRFITPRVPAGRYLLRVGSSPAGWTLRSVMYDGHDIADVAVDLKGPANDIVMTFTDRITSLAGSVRAMPGAVVSDLIVLLFPADPGAWEDFGLNPRRFKTTRVDESGSYTFADIPSGEYLIVATSEEDTAVWRTPARLTALSRLATRIHVNEGDKATQELRQVNVR